MARRSVVLCSIPNFLTAVFSQHFPPLPMTDLARSPTSLAWRLALTAVFLRLAYAAVVQTYTMFGLPQSLQMREMHTEPQFLAPLLAHIAAAAAIAGLTTWGAMRRWLERHNTTAVDEPRKLFGTFIALLLVYTLAVAAGGGLAGVARFFFLAALVAFGVFLAFDVFAGALDLRDQAGAGARAGALGGFFGVGVARRFLDRQRLARTVVFIRGHTNPGECAKVGGIRRV